MFGRGFGRRQSQARSAQADAQPARVEDVTEGGPGYPRDFAVSSLRERRLAASLRIVGFGLFASLILNLIQGYSFMALFPLKEIRPFLVQVAEEGAVVAAVRPIQDSFDAKDLLTEKLVREYIVNRHEVLRSTAVMTQRWSPSGYLGVTTSQDEYGRFREAAAPVIEEIRRLNGERRVEIVSVNPLVVGKAYVVDFRARSFDQSDRMIDDRVYTATVEIDFRVLASLTREQMMLNPTGFVVVNHSLAEKTQ